MNFINALTFFDLQQTSRWNRITKIEVFEGIIILSGENSYPDRLKDRIASFPKDVKDNLVWAYDWKGSVWFCWKETTPNYILAFNHRLSLKGDEWSIMENFTDGEPIE